MFNFKNNALVILLILIIFILIPVSFAQDLDNSSYIDESGVNEDILSADEEEAWIEMDKNEFSVDEDDSVEIGGSVYIDIIDGSYPGELNIQCSYTDNDGVERSYTTQYYDYGFIFDTNNFEGLSARDSPYILSFSVVDDSLLEEFTDWYYIDAIGTATASIKINEVVDYGPTVPEYETFTPKGQIYVAENGKDSNDGSELAPFASISKAIERNKALGGNYEIIVKEGWYILSEACTISNNVRITGKGKVEIINGGTTDGYLFFTSGPNIIEFNNLTISGGTSGAIAGSTTIAGNDFANDGKVLNIINCTFEDNAGNVGVITTYSKTTIISSTFINNNAYGYGSYFRGLISARDNSLRVNFCTFIDNTLASGNPLIYSDVKTDANYNFWGNNEGYKSDYIIGNKVKSDNWIVIVPKLSNESAVLGNNYELDIKFMYTNASGKLCDIDASMPDLPINIGVELGKIDSTSKITNNAAVLDYKATTKGIETVTVYIGKNIISDLSFNVLVPENDKIYVSTMGIDTNDGSRNNPLRTIKVALNKNMELGGDKTIVILSGTYFENNLNIKDKVTIIGEGNPIIDANNENRIFIIDNDCDIYSITLTNGYVKNDLAYYNYGGAIYHNSGNLKIFDSLFINNHADNSGGAIASHSNLNINNTTFTNNEIGKNSKDYKGSAIFSDSKMIITNSTFSNNVASNSYGCVYIGSDADILESTFMNNEANLGGAIYIDATGSEITIKNNSFSSNKANLGGAIYVGNGEYTLIEANNFNKNSAINGGAIYLYGLNSPIYVNSNNFNENKDDAIYIMSSNVDLLNNTISGENKINFNQGNIGNIIVIFNENKTLKLKSGEIKLNATVTDDMGNIINGGKITFTIDGSEIGKADVINGVASLSKQLDTGDYLISGSFSGSNNLYIPLEVKTSLVRINVPDAWFIGDVGYETLQEAIDAAEINDVIKGIPGIYEEPIINVGHRYRPGEPWVINKAITITSLTDDPITLKADSRYIFYIDYYSNVTFKNIIFTGGNNPNGWAGAVDSMGKNTIIVENCTFIDNIAEKGAAIYSYGNLFVKDSVFINNEAKVFGGAIVKDGDGDFIVENCIFYNNSAYTYAGAVDARGYSDVNILFKNVTFDNNDATCAGAVYTSGKNVTFIDCNFTNNKAIDKNCGYDPLGGAVYVHNGATNFTNVIFLNNYAEGSGGALQLENGVTSIVNSSGRHVTIHWGVLNNCLIENNTALGDGGAISTIYTPSMSHINITNTIIRNNTAKNAAVFTNAYSFYTLENVLIENNKNTDGDTLIYTYGMYSFPYSYYANTTLINTTFRNNGVKYVVKTSTIYSTVNITDSLFDGEGCIVYSFEGSFVNLTNNVERNPIGELSVDNTGTLSLKNNTFVNPIYNKATINTPTFIYVLDNTTIRYEVGESIELVANVVDDNNNSIIGGILAFNVPDEIPSEIKNNSFAASYNVVNGNQLINATYSDLGLLDLNVKYAIIIGETTLIPVVSDIKAYYSFGKFNVTVTDSKGNPVSDINLIITVGTVDYPVDVDVNGVAMLNLDLHQGTYKVTTKFLGNDKYSPFTVYSTITVLSSVKSSDLSRGYKSPYDFTVTLYDNNGNTLKNVKVNLNVNGKIYSVNTDSNGIAKLTNKLSVGSYSVTVSNPVTTEKVTNKVTIVKRITEDKDLVMDYKDGSKYKVRAIGDNGKPVGAGQIVKITVCGKTYTCKTDKNGYATLPINLLPKTFKITSEYKGYKVTHKLTVKPVIKANSITKKKTSSFKYSATLKNSKGKPLVGKKVLFKIKGKTYSAKTNKNGLATVNIKNLKVGKYKVSIIYIESRLTKNIVIKR